MKLHEWNVTNSEGTFLKRIVTATKDRKIAQAKVKALYGENACFVRLSYKGTFEDQF
jgi:hypothetical protein